MASSSPPNSSQRPDGPGGPTAETPAPTSPDPRASAELGAYCAADDAQAEPISVVPIRPLGAEHREQVLAHLLALDRKDRFLRFGHVATDAQIRTYVAGIDFARDEVFGVFNRRLELIAMAHLAVCRRAGRVDEAEFGVSVLPQARGKGMGTRLFQRAAMFARNRGIRTLRLQCLTQNSAMVGIARRAGMKVQTSGPDTEASLEVPAASLRSQLEEWVDNATGQIDFALKLGLRRAPPGR